VLEFLGWFFTILALMAWFFTCMAYICILVTVGLYWQDRLTPYRGWSYMPSE